jgi:hypothetical protein
MGSNSTSAFAVIYQGGGGGSKKAKTSHLKGAEIPKSKLLSLQGWISCINLRPTLKICALHPSFLHKFTPI